MVEVVVDRSTDGRELLQGHDVPESCHRAVLSSERQMGVFGSIVELRATLLIGPIADIIHCYPVGP